MENTNEVGSTLRLILDRMKEKDIVVTAEETKNILDKYDPTYEEILSLRINTGAGMMDCKKALIESNGDKEMAKEILKYYAKKGHIMKDKWYR